MTGITPQSGGSTAFQSTRRAFFSFTAGSALLISNPSFAAKPRSDAKRLHIVHAHSGEKFDGIYWSNGAYLEDAVRAVSRLMRDVNDNEVRRIDPGILDLMMRFSARLQLRDPLQVVSGYRSPKSNHRAWRENRGVAKNSLHMQGKAVDVRIPGVHLAVARATAISMQAGGVGIYKGANFLHLDTGPVRSWG
jgi:uncharacterized protein YcbK (DUF882 family)